MKLSGALAGSTILWIATFVASLVPVGVKAAPDPAEVKAVMKKAATWFRETAAVEGGYVYFYSPDLSRRLGEGAALPTEIWVQPPGTPTVGMAFLDALDATGDPFYREAALEVGRALIYGQLESGGWRNSIDFDPSGPRVDQYRNGKGRGKNYSTLDDGITQAALRFLVRLDAACNFTEKEVGDSVRYAFDRFLAAQFANGAFPQVWQGPVKDVSVIEAKYPDYDWRTEGRIKEYWDQYTLNDGVAGTVTELLITAHEVYRDERYLEALNKLGEFLILAQMPDPQPAWAQQYNEAMQPIWARAFEPPAISGRESEDVMIALLRIAAHTGDRRYLDPIVAAVKYLESSALPDGRMARYYELQSNRPLYMERDGKVYSLTYDDSNLPSHYGWKNESRLDLIKSAYRAFSTGGEVASVLHATSGGLAEVEAAVRGIDGEGRWISRYEGELLIGQAKFQSGEEYVSSEVFANNVALLCSYLRSKGE